MSYKFISVNSDEGLKYADDILMLALEKKDLFIDDQTPTISRFLRGCELYAITRNSELMGFYALEDNNNYSTSMHFCIYAKYKKFSISAGRKVLNNIFSSGIKRIEGIIKESSLKQRRFAEFLNFKSEGVLRKFRTIKGYPVDFIQYALILEDFNNGQ